MFSSDLRLVTCTCDLQVEPLYTISQTFAKALLNQILTVLYKCRSTLVTTSEAGDLLFVLVTFFIKIVSPRCVKSTVRLVNYTCYT